jgi:sugar/nucleoside kinase (ribokinase family)
MKKVLGIGNALVDIIIKLNNDHLLNDFYLPKGSMQLVDAVTATNIEKSCSELSKSMASGGSSANTIHGLARLGVTTGFIGSVGQDELGKFFQEDMVRAGIEPYLSFSDTETGRAISLVSTDSERTFATFLGAATDITEKNLRLASFQDYDFLHVEGYLAPLKNFVETAMKKAKQLNMQVSLDLASYNVVESNLDFLQKIMHSYVDIVFANEEEAKAYTGLEDSLESLHDLSRSVDIAVVKTGKKGSLVQHGHEVFTLGIAPANAIDTTGAGDLYASGFLYGLIQGLPLEQCGNIGALLAANVIEELGAKISEDRWEKIKQLLGVF